MLYREIIAVCSQIHTKHINTLCGQNVDLLNFKIGGTYSDHWIWKVNEICYEDVPRVCLAQYRVQWRDFVDAIMNHQLLQKVGNFFTGW